MKNQSSIKDAMVIASGAENLIGLAVLTFLVENDFQLAALAVVYGDPILKGLRLAQPIDDADAFARLEILGFIADLELVQFLQHRNRNRHIMFLKSRQRAVVEKQDAGV